MKNVELAIKDVTKWDQKFNMGIKKWLESVSNNKAHKFDIVSCMFALNYFFVNEQSINNVFKMITQGIKRNGLFIGAFLDGNKLIDFMKKNGVKKKGDQYVSDNLMIENTWGATTQPNLYGSSYKFQIKDSKDKNIYQVGEEYVVNYDWLVQLARSYGFEDATYELNDNLAGFPIESRLFENIYPRTLQIESEKKYFLNHNEETITSFYSIFCFKYTGK